MWTSDKKKKEDIFSGVKNMELEFAATWRHDKKEVRIMTNEGQFILNEKTEFFVEISTDNFNPIKVQIVPDFKTRKLNFIEVLDPNVKIDENKGTIFFSGQEKSASKSIGTYLVDLDEDIKIVEKDLKMYKRRKLILVSFSAFVILFNGALFIVNTYPGRYLNIIAIMICLHVIYRLHRGSKDIYKRYNEIKMMKNEMFETVKDV